MMASKTSPALSLAHPQFFLILGMGWGSGGFFPPLPGRNQRLVMSSETPCPPGPGKRR